MAVHTPRWCQRVLRCYYMLMDANIMSGMIGIVFLVLCIGFVSALPAPRQASEHPFLDPNVASVGAALYLNERGTYSVERARQY